jgi:hypothetical protein
MNCRVGILFRFAIACGYGALKHALALASMDGVECRLLRSETSMDGRQHYFFGFTWSTTTLSPATAIRRGTRGTSSGTPTFAASSNN